MGNGALKSTAIVENAESELDENGMVKVSLKYEDFQERQMICQKSWHEMSLKIEFDGYVAHCSSGNFSKTFFYELKKIDTKGTTWNTFHNPPAVGRENLSSKPLKNTAILFRIVNYILNISDEVGLAKHHLRRLGKIHGRYNIMEPELQLFQAAFLITLTSMGIDQNVISAWSSLLFFVIHEMSMYTTSTSISIQHVSSTESKATTLSSASVSTYIVKQELEQNLSQTALLVDCPETMGNNGSVS